MEAAWGGQHNAGRLERAHRVPLLCGCVLGEVGVCMCMCVSAHMYLGGVTRVSGGVTRVWWSSHAAVGGSALQHLWTESPMPWQL